jgi:hypothetical protein
LFWLSLFILAGTLGSEGYVLFHGIDSGVSDMVVGRVLGLMDSVALLVLNYWYGTSASSDRKTEIIAQKEF